MKKTHPEKSVKKQDQGEKKIPGTLLGGFGGNEKYSRSENTREENILSLIPLVINEHERKTKKKRKIMSEIARTGDKSKLTELVEFEGMNSPTLLTNSNEAKSAEIYDALMIGKNEGIKITDRELQKERGSKGGKVDKKLPGLIFAAKMFKGDNKNVSKGYFLQCLSKKEYTQKTPYKVRHQGRQYELYVDNGFIYHRDSMRKAKQKKIIWDRLKISSLDRYFYYYAK